MPPPPPEPASGQPPEPRRPPGAVPSPAELSADLVEFTVGRLESLLAGPLAGWQVPRVYGGHRVAPDVAADLCFTAGLLAAAGVERLGGVPIDDGLRRVLAVIDGPGTHTFFSYRIAETLGRHGPFAVNPLLDGLDDARRAAVADACDSTDWLSLLDAGLPRNYGAVLARCESARAALGLPTDPTVLADLLARTETMLAADPDGYLDDSEDGTGARYDIYSADVYLFTEPLADRLGPVWERGARTAVGLVEATVARNGAAVSWGRSTGLLALCLTVELAALVHRRHLGGDQRRWRALAARALRELPGWYVDGVTSAHQHRSPYGYRGPARRLQLTLDSLGKLAWAAHVLVTQPADPPGPPGPPDPPGPPGPTFPEADRWIPFGPTGRAGVWAHRSAGSAFTLAVTGTTRSDYQPAPANPGLFEVPVDRDLASWVPTVHRGEQRWVGGGLPTTVEHRAGGLHLTYDALAPAAELWAGGAEPIPAERTVRWQVDGRTLRVEEHLRFTAGPPDAVSVAVPECTGRPLRVRFASEAAHRARVVDTGGMKEWRSFWSELPRLHELDLEPADALSWSVAVTPLLRVATESGHHHYHRSLYDPLLAAERVVEHPFASHHLARPDEAVRRLGPVDQFHLHWPEWFTGDDLDAARRFLDVLAEAEVRLIWTQHNLRPHWDHEHFAELYQLVAAAADGIIHHSAWGRDRALERYAYKPEAVHAVIPHGHWGHLLADELRDRSGAGAALRATVEAELGLAPLPPGGIRIGVVGAPRRDKRTAALMEAFAATRRDDLQLLVLSLGDGEEAPNDPRIVARPYEFVDRDLYNRRLAAIDVIALPFDPAGDMLTTGVVADVVAVGMPALVSSWPFLVEDLGSAGVALGDDVAGMTTALEGLDRAALEPAAEAARTLWDERSWDRIAATTFELLEQVGTTKL